MVPSQEDSRIQIVWHLLSSNIFSEAKVGGNKTTSPIINKTYVFIFSPFVTNHILSFPDSSPFFTMPINSSTVQVRNESGKDSMSK